MGIEVELIRLGKLNRLANSDLDSNWRDIDYCAIDLETTGLNLKRDEIISIGAIQIHQARIKTEENYYREVRPIQMPSPLSIVIHGIRAIDLETAPRIKDVLPDFVERMRGRVLIAHAAWVENAFLKRHLDGADLNILKRLIDTASLARTGKHVVNDIDREPSLELLAHKLNLPVYSPHHALGDALTTAIVFLALVTELEREKLDKGASMLTLRDLLKTSAKAART